MSARSHRRLAARHRHPRVVTGIATAVALVLLAGACGGKGAPSGTDDFGAADCKSDDCVVVDLAISPEKVDLLTDVAKTFNASNAKVNNKRIVVQPKSKSSGGATDLLANGWDANAEGPQPVIWSPAASAWGAVLDQRLTAKGQKPMANQGTPFMNTPLVIAMPKPMADALGYPKTAIGWADILRLANDPQGWEAYGHPEWGPFRLGKTNPNFSTSGLHASIAQNYAATGKTSGLTAEDLARPDVQKFNADVESAVVHYGDTTLTFLNNWYRADQRSNPFTYASAVAIEEKSVIDYNAGNPDGKLDQGEDPRKPKVPLVAVYPKEGTLFSDNPFFILDASWVSQEEKDAAKVFQDYVLQPDNQKRVLQFGFRPGNPQVAIDAPIISQNGVDPTQPQTTMQVPSPSVMIGVLDQWKAQRKDARVLLVMDVSGSMGDAAGSAGSKLDLAKSAATASLDEFKPEDLVGLREFSTGLGAKQTDFFVDLVPIAPMATQQEKIRVEIQGLFPTNGTPLYDVAKSSMEKMITEYDPTKINAVVLLTDGKNEDGKAGDDPKQLAELQKYLQEQTLGELGKPVRLFTIGYGGDADTNVLKQMAESTNGSFYSASDPKTINKVFTAVVSNF